MRWVWIMLGAAALLGAGCGPKGIGGACAGGPTEQGVCVEGAVCTPDRSSTDGPPEDPNAEPGYCRQICDDPGDCTERGFECRGISGAMLSACQPIVDGSDGGA
jgi:hypothetical protein